MEIITYFNSLTPHYKFGAIIAIATIAALIFRFIIKDILAHWASKTETKADDLIVEKTSTAIFLLIFSVGFRIAFGYLPNKDEVIFNHVFDSLTILLIMYICIVIIDIIIAEITLHYVEKTESKINDQLMPLIRKAMKVIIIIVAALFILHEWEINLTPVLAGLGIAGIAVGFALQATLENVFGGVSMIADKSVRMGDVIKLESGETGVVQDVGVRSTRIRTFDNEELIVPNGIFSKTRVTNWTLPESPLRCVIDFGVAYGSNTDKVKKLVKKTINQLKPVLNTKDRSTEVYLIDMGDFALKFRAIFWVKEHKDRFVTTEEARCLIYDALNKEKINIPFPTQTVYVKNKKV